MVTSDVVVRRKLDQAAAFARAFDYTGAVSRAKEAVRIASAAPAREEANLELRRFEAMERAWRARIVSQARRYEAEEAAMAEVAQPVPPATRRARRQPSSWRRAWRDLRARLRQDKREAFA